LQVSSFIGRDTELARTDKALHEARAVTLTGVGGVGKTRLALQAAAVALPRFPGGAWLVELAGVRDPAGVANAVATTLDVSARGGKSVDEALVDFLRLKRLLLLLDNAEHLLEAVAELVDVLERSCPGLVVLVTSREGLALEGERVLPVPALAAPPGTPVEAAAAADAVRLFTERAQAVDPEFGLSEANVAPVVELCRRLDGVPLAIELAAARITAMTPAELARGLDRRFAMLAGGRRRAVQGHQTLRAAIDWSYELLTVAERRLLARLAVFAAAAPARPPSRCAELRRCRPAACSRGWPASSPNRSSSPSAMAARPATGCSRPFGSTARTGSPTSVRPTRSAPLTRSTSAT
jgi:predicted ATPase